METTLRILVSLGFAFLLVMLRLEAERFGAAEYDETDEDGFAPSLRRRLAWYILGFGLLAAIWVIHPQPGEELYLRLGDRDGAILGGLALGALGTAQAAGFAWRRYRRLRLPMVRSYPGALLNEVATAFIDEAVFRGVILGFLVISGLDVQAAIAIQTLLYALSTRLGKRGRDLYMLALALAVGLAGGWLTVRTGGIGAAFLGHAITRIAVFLCTGHAGRVSLRTREAEEIERERRPPEGWRVIGGRESAARDR